MSVDDQQPESSGPIVVAYSEGLESLTALRYAARLAQLRWARLTVAYSVYVPYTGLGFTDNIGEELRARGADLLERAVAMAQLPADVEVKALISQLGTIPLLSALSETAQLVVLAQHRSGLVELLTEGRIAGPLAARSRCPVLIVPPDVGPLRRDLPVVVAVEGSAASQHALGFAFEEASLRRAALVVLHATGSPHAAPVDTEEDSPTALAALVSGWRSDYPDVEVELRVVPGDPRELIVEQSMRASLMVVGHPHHHGFGAWTRSVAHAVLESTACPLALVPCAPEIPTRIRR